MIVSNATPLLAFARIDALELLVHIVRHILIPETVWHEVTCDPWRPGAEAIRHASWVEVHSVATIPSEILPLLDRGEAEVIALAEAIVATEVVLDERAARAVATAQGLKIIGTARLLVRAKHQGLILTVRPWLERMQNQSMRYSQRFVEELFCQLGE
jgi:predicted nucleic acid-binding protein